MASTRDDTMTKRIAAILTLLASTGLALADDGKPAPKPRKKVLVELYTSQGCNSCPSANQFLGEFAGLGYGPEKVVPLAFHVDDFNHPLGRPVLRGRLIASGRGPTTRS